MKYEIFVSGLVQGVGFRFFLKRRASILNIKGFAENLPDGRVHVIVESKDESAVKKFLEYCKRGPLFAKVEDVKINKLIEKSDKEAEYSSFKIY